METIGAFAHCVGKKRGWRLCTSGKNYANIKTLEYVKLEHLKSLSDLMSQLTQRVIK